MTKEFKKISSEAETRYVLESMTAGGTGAGSIATATGTTGKVQKRGNLLAQEASKDKVPAEKPRNFVAKNAKMGGAGAHKDKKKAEKQGNAKHKKPFAESIAELKDKFEELKEAGQYVRPGSPSAYNRDYAASRTGFGRRGPDVSGEDEPEGIFTVMINGKPWKTATSNEAFLMAQRVANKHPDKQVAVKWPNGTLNTVKASAFKVSETAPKGWEGTVKAMKKHKEIDNPYALTNYMKNKGYKSHKPAKESVDPYLESLATKLNNVKKK